MSSLDPGRSLSKSPLRKSGGRKRLTSPFKKLFVSTSPGSPLARQRLDSSESELSEPGTPFSQDRYQHTTYTTYVKGTKYTRYEITKKRHRPFDLDLRPDIFQTTYKTMKLNTVGKPSWYTHVTLWTQQKKHGQAPST